MQKATAVINYLSKIY